MKIFYMMDANILKKVPLEEINMENDAYIEIHTTIITPKNKDCQKTEANFIKYYWQGG